MRPQKKLSQDPNHTQFICSVNDYQYRDIMSYSDIINKIANQEDEDILWKFKRIFAHDRPLNQYHTNSKGYLYNVMVELETWENTTETLSIIA